MQNYENFQKSAPLGSKLTWAREYLLPRKFPIHTSYPLSAKTNAIEEFRKEIKLLQRDNF